MDIYDILGNDFGHEFSALQAIGQEKKAVILRWRANRQDDDPLRDHYDPILNRVLKIVNTELEDDLLQSWKQNEPRNKIWQSPQSKPFHLITALPLMIGILDWCIKIFMHKAGIAIANTDLAVLSTSYMYSASRRDGTITNVWYDMKFVIEEQSMNGPFIRDAHAAPDAMARHFGLAVGVKPTAYAKKKQDMRAQLPRSWRRAFENATHISSNSPFLATIKSVAGQRKMPQQFTIESFDWLIESIVHTLARRTGKIPNQKNLSLWSKDSKRHEKYTPIELLSAYKDVAVLDEPHINFDYVTFTMRCLNILNSVRTANIACLRKGLRLNLDKAEFNAYEMVDEIFWTAALELNKKNPSKDTMLRSAGTEAWHGLQRILLLAVY